MHSFQRLGMKRSLIWTRSITTLASQLPNRLEQLKSSGLVKTSAYINNKWISAESNNNPTFDVIDPGNSQVLCSVVDATIHDADASVAAAAHGFQTWKKYTAKERSAVLSKIAKLHHEHIDELAEILTLESGKPKAEAIGEIQYGASYFEWYAEEAKRMDGSVIPDPVLNRRCIVLREPVGVCLLITPWNFPNAMISRKASAALAAGCSVIIKPAPDTPLSALAIAELAHRAGLPNGVLNVLPSSIDNTPALTSHLMAKSEIKKLSFTGSTAVGKLLLKSASDSVKKCGVELGGNAAFIVFDDADINNAIDHLIKSKFRNSGQTCVCANRIFVHEKVADEFTTGLIKAVKQMKVGHGLSPDTILGPLINKNALAKVESFLADAKNLGAKVECGGERPQQIKDGFFFEPTVLTNVNESMQVLQQEIFGPLCPIKTFADENEVINLANATDSGLASYVFTENLSRAFRMIENLEMGMVGVNSGVISAENAPFGGVKQSGFGREGSKYGLDEYTQLKYAAVQLE